MIRCPPKRRDKHYNEIDNRTQTSRSVPLNKSTWKHIAARKEVRDFVTRPELFSLLMWLPSLVVSSLLSPVPSVGQRTFSPAAFQRESASNFFEAAIPAKIYRSDGRTDGRTAEMQGSFLRVRGERPHVPVSAICSKNSRGRREPSRRKGRFLDFSYKL